MKRRLLLSIASIALGLIIVLSIAKPAAAAAPATGGCAERVGGPNNSFEMGVCISDRGHSTKNIYPDVYVNQYPSGSYSCTLYIEVWASNSRQFVSGGYPCTGYSQATFNDAGGAAKLHSSVWISFNGAFYRIGDSPTYYYQP